VSNQELTNNEWREIDRAIARLRASVMAVVFAMVGGFGLFVATMWLVIQGGKVVGPTLSLLSNYYPGYTVTVGGSFIGLVYGALTGALIGYVFALVYNLIAGKRHGPAD
jgi:hypothetical protein